MYSSELAEQYRNVDAARKHNLQKKDRTAKLRTAKNNVHGAAITYSAVQEKAAVDHFRQTCRDDCVYSIRLDSSQPPSFMTADDKRSILDTSKLKALESQVADLSTFGVFSKPIARCARPTFLQVFLFYRRPRQVYGHQLA
jgi:hypothetical protein